MSPVLKLDHIWAKRTNRSSWARAQQTAFDYGWGAWMYTRRAARAVLSRTETIVGMPFVDFWVRARLQDAAFWSLHVATATLERAQSGSANTQPRELYGFEELTSTDVYAAIKKYLPKVHHGCCSCNSELSLGRPCYDITDLFTPCVARHATAREVATFLTERLNVFGIAGNFVNKAPWSLFDADYRLSWIFNNAKPDWTLEAHKATSKDWDGGKQEGRRILDMTAGGKQEARRVLKTARKAEDSEDSAPRGGHAAARSRYQEWLRRVDAVASQAHDDALFAVRTNGTAMGDPDTVARSKELVARNVGGHSIHYDSLPLAPELCSMPHHRWVLLGESNINARKWVCVDSSSGKLFGHRKRAQDGCRVISIGSAGSFLFEEALFAQFPDCVVDTFDCTAPNQKWRVPNAIRSRARLHRICVGVADEMIVSGPFTSELIKPAATLYRPRGIDGGNHKQKPGPQLSWASMLRYVNITMAPTLLKIDCEGCEYEVFDNIVSAKQQTLLPAQVAIEAHTPMEPLVKPPFKYGGDVFKWMRDGGAPPLQTFFQGLYREAGYYVAHREDSPLTTCCSELVLLSHGVGHGDER